jgi:hypothetical protein
MSANHNDAHLVADIVKLYFTGAYRGDENDLKHAFHPDTHITGILNNQYYDWTLAEFITRVTAKPTAAMKEEKYDKEILSIEITNNAAIVKARAAVGDIIFTDYITLLKIEGQWVIRSKSFTN